MALTPIEQEARRAGYVRSPNGNNRWYPGSPGIYQPIRCMDVRIENGAPRPVVLSCRLYGGGSMDVMRFGTWTDFMAYVKDQGMISEPGLPAFSNSWD